MDAFRDAGRPVKWDGQRQLQRAMAVLGESPTFLGLREVSCGRDRFDDMQRHSEVSRQVLADRSATLVAHDTLAKIPIISRNPDTMQLTPETSSRHLGLARSHGPRRLKSQRVTQS